MSNAPESRPILQSQTPLWSSVYSTNEGLVRRIRPRHMTTPAMVNLPTSTSTTHDALARPTLAALWLGDIVMALSVTVAVAPALTAVDKAIVEQSAAGGRNIMLHSMKQTALGILSNPVAYYRSPTFGWMSLTYIATYTTANMLKTWNDHSQQYDKPTTYNHSKTRNFSSQKDSVVVAATTCANSAASLVKDRAYARMFGQVPRPVPALSYAAWLSRDAFGIGSGFVLPAYVTPHVQAVTGWSQETSATVSQMGTPVLAQTIAGPLHLLGLTIYNARPQDSLATQYQSFSNSVKSVTIARMLRFLPGYGIAGVLNQKGRVWWKQQVHHYLPLWWWRWWNRPAVARSPLPRPGKATLPLDLM